MGRKKSPAAKRVNAQKKQAAIRKKYGPKRKPAPVTVKRLDGFTGEWEVVETCDQSRFGRDKPKPKKRGVPASWKAAERAVIDDAMNRP